MKEITKRIYGSTINVLRVRRLGSKINDLTMLTLRSKIYSTRLLNNRIIFGRDLTVRASPYMLQTKGKSLSIKIYLRVFMGVLLIINTRPRLTIRLADGRRKATLNLTIATCNNRVLRQIYIRGFCSFVRKVCLRALFFFKRLCYDTLYTTYRMHAVL